MATFMTAMLMMAALGSLLAFGHVSAVNAHITSKKLSGSDVQRPDTESL